LTWFDQMGFAEGDYGLAETLSKAKNTSVAGMMDAGHSLIGRRQGSPVEARRTQCKLGARDRYTQASMGGAASLGPRPESRRRDRCRYALAARLGSRADAARELAYRLYILCERKHRAQEALAYNALVQSWPEIQRLASETEESRPVQPQQASMFS
jgi:putative DNA methylase